MSYQPPPGPPPEKSGHRLFPSSSSASEYQPPPGPPPNYASSSSGYQPPPGPPPGKSSAPDEAPPPYHDWTIIPDTSTLPPPPGLSQDFSSGANATKDEADQALQWCYFNPLWDARPLSHQQLEAIHAHAHILVKPPTFTGDIRQDNQGDWRCHTSSSCPDSLLQTALPCYSAPADSPLLTERSKTIYFEVKIFSFGSSPKKASKPSSLFSRHHHAEPAEPDSGIALGFFAPPYPTFRLPGWQRGSLAIHSDDGNRYVNDTHGGMPFTTPFLPGETLGVGMRFSIPSSPPAYGEPVTKKLDVRVFFTREGREEGGWDLHEERDVDDEVHGVEGLEGAHDLFPAVGVFGAVEFEVRFLEREWLFRPRN